MLSAPQLLGALGGSIRVEDGWAEVIVARQPFRFLVGAPLYVFSSQLQTLAAPVWLSRDTLYLPFQFVSEIIPYYLGERYRYDGRRARLEDITGGRARHAGARSVAWPTGSGPGTSSPSIRVTAGSIPATRGPTFPAACGRRM